MASPFRPGNPSHGGHAAQLGRVIAIRVCLVGAAVGIGVGRLLVLMGVLRLEGAVTARRLLHRNLVLAALLLAWKLFQVAVLRK